MSAATNASEVRMLGEGITWHDYPVPSTLSAAHVNLRIGTIGSGRPLALIVASQHGDEGPWGTRAIRKLLETTPASDLRGTMRIVPIANPLAFEENSREAHIDDEDLNSLLPGDPDGRHTERLAHTFVTEAAAGVDAVIDIHGGGSWCVNAFVYRFEGGHDLANWIGGPFVRAGHERGEKSLTCYARNRGAKVVWIEMGGAGSTEELWAERIATGMRRALGKLGVLSLAELPDPEPAIELDEAKSLRTPIPGLYLPAIREAGVGSIVDEHTLIGSTIDPWTNDVLHEFRAPFARTALLLLRPRLAVVEAGEMIMALGKVE